MREIWRERVKNRGREREGDEKEERDDKNIKILRETYTMNFFFLSLQ